MTSQRVVVTGIGIVSPVGNDEASFWSNLTNGVSGIDTVQSFDVSALPTKIAGEVKGFNVTDFMDPKEAKRNDRNTHLAVAASKMAVKSANLDVTSMDPFRFGAFIASGIGGIHSIQENTRKMFEGGVRKISPFMITQIICNMASGIVAIEVGARGPNFAVVSACAAGSHAIGEAFHTIKRGDADAMLAGGTEASINDLGLGGFCAMKAMSTRNDDPKTASRPFDKERDGFVMGEGSGVLVLESLEHAKKRGARILAEVVGYGATCDAYHITSPDPEGRGLSEAMKRSLHMAGIEPKTVDYINAHGTSTPYNDKFETMAIKHIWGADDARKVAISSTKSMMGHLLGAAGGAEAIVCIKAIQTGVIPPTINLVNPDPDCDLDYVPHVKREKKVRYAMSNNLGFGGHNASLLFKAYEE